MSIIFAFAMLALTDPPAQDAPAPNPVDAEVSGVVVNGAKPQVETSIDRKSYSVANDLNAQGGTVADVLRNIPSVQVDAQGNLTLRGAGNVTVLIDGRPSAQFSGGNVGQALQSLPADQIDRIEVMTSPSAEFRAEGTGGIINLVTKKAKGAGHTGSLRVTAATHHNASATLNLGYNSDRFSATGDVTYRRDRNATFQTAQESGPDITTGVLMDNRDDRSNHGLDNTWQGHAGFDYDLDSRTRLSGSVRLFSQTGHGLEGDQFNEVEGGLLTSAFHRASSYREGADIGEAQLGWRRTWAPDHDLRLNAGYSQQVIRTNRLDLIDQTTAVGSPPPSQEVTSNNLSRRTTLTADYQQALAGGKLKAGYDFEYAPARINHQGGTNPGPGPVALDPADQDIFLDDETDNAAYVSYERQFGKTTVLAGLRGETADLALDQQTLKLTADRHYARLFPNLHLAYDLGDGRQLTASASRRNTRPSASVLDPFVYSSNPTFANAGNIDMRPDDFRLYEVGYEDRKGGRTFSAGLYYQDLRNAFNVVTTVLPDGVLLESSTNVGWLHRAGAEWSFSDKLTPRLSYNISLNGYWIELGSTNISLAPTASAVTGFGNANLNWQVTPKDFLQVNVFTNSRFVQPQGYSAAYASGNVGYRHIVNAKASWMLVVQDPFNTVHQRLVFDTDGVIDHRSSRTASRAALLTFVWNFAGKAKADAFDFAH
jgi:outer membrane receptor protein involved in Fe transport